MRKKDLVKTKYSGIYSYEVGVKKYHFYAHFMLDGTRYQYKNLTKLDSNVTTGKKADDKLDEIKSLLRKGEDPFDKNISKETIKDIILDLIEKKKPKYKEKSNDPYRRNLKLFFLKYVDPVIGHLKFQKVTDKHVDKILKSIDHLSKGRKLFLHILMFHEFENRFRARKIDYNPFFDIDYGQDKTKPSLDIRLNESLESVIKKLYKTTLELKTNQKLLFLISIMCARRVGEIHQLKFKNIKKSKEGLYYVSAEPEITKTGIYEKYPIPKEVIKLLPLEVLEEEYEETPLFNFCRNTIYTHYPKLLRETKISFNNDYSLSTHDHRRIFISLMVKKGFDSDMLDQCLSHKNKQDIKDIYMEVGFEKRTEIFNKYWKLIRSKS